MHEHHPGAALWLASLSLCAPAAALATTAGSSSVQTETASPAVELDPIVVDGRRTGTEGVPSVGSQTVRDGSEIHQGINAVDSEDALKYLPSLNVRKRYAGDYDHAVLSSRSSGSGNSARTLVFADGLLLSNLLGNGVSYTPRWGMLSPDAIDEVQVDYGPFHAAWSGNSLGAVVRYRTRMPTRFESRVQASQWWQPWSLYGDSGSYHGQQASASLGNRHGAWSWSLGLTALDSESQPLSYATRLRQAGSADPGGIEVTGAVAGRNPRGQDWLVLGSSGQTHSQQQQLRLRLGWDISNDWRLLWSGGLWHNDAERRASSWLRDSQGAVVSSGTVRIDGLRYTLSPADFAGGLQVQQHVMQGLSLRSQRIGSVEWELGLSQYRYLSDESRTPTTYAPAGAGRLGDMSGSGWVTAQAGGVAHRGAHQVQLGWQYSRYRLQSTQRTVTQDWRNASADALFALSSGTTELQALFAQDDWQLARSLRAALGVRLEQWQAHDGRTASAGSAVVDHGTERDEVHVSPKLGLAWQVTPRLGLRLASGRAVRMPTAVELFQGSVVADSTSNSGWSLINSDPALRPEVAWSTELSADQVLDSGLVRVALFHEDTHDALYSQRLATSSDPSASTVQNVDHIRTWGVELVHRMVDVGLDGLSVDSSITWTDSEIVANRGLPSSEGKRQPRVPEWRASLLAQWVLNPRWTWSFGARYSGRQYGQLDNSDDNGNTWTGFGSWVVSDTRLIYRPAPRWTMAAGVDNLTSRRYWAFHPYPQRTWLLEVRYAP